MFPGYTVTQEISSDSVYSRYRLYRARRVADGQPVLIKAAKPKSNGPHGDELLAREYNILHSLNVESVPKVIELLHTPAGVHLVICDPGGLPLCTELAPGRITLDQFLRLAVRITSAVGEIHRRRIVLRCINPEGVFVDPSQDRISIVDMSLANPIAPPASDLPSEDDLQGLLGYCAPELTGRMNRAVDFSSDLYSLGVLFYELITGRLPFESSDPIELIHRHLAVTPLEPAAVDPHIPEQLSRLVMKMLAKAPEDRYQTAAGLYADIETCTRDWMHSGRIRRFALGACDVADSFSAPEKLYGRQREAEDLTTALNRACSGRTTIVLVQGESGIGKTSLILQLCKPMIRRRGYFITGKFDQVCSATPYGVLIRALRELVSQLLGESEAQLATWRARLSEVLGANAGAIAEVLPEIELILGKQPPSPSVAPAEALNRFQSVFHNLIAAVARPEHPLVVFLDDLQWADAGTLELIQTMLTRNSTLSLLLIGAFRDGETDDDHPLSRVLATMESAGIAIERIIPAPLNREDMERMLAETLRCNAEQSASLASYLLDKTGGNPFFVTQLLKSLSEEGRLRFDQMRRQWVYRIDEETDESSGNEAVDLITRRLIRLSDDARHALTAASLMGNSFDAATIAIVTDRPSDVTVKALLEAVEQTFLIQSQEQTFSFLHDQVQLAAYSLIPERDRPSVHLAVGRLLQTRGEPVSEDDHLFDVVHHLNIGAGLIEDHAERLALARLNLSAGGKALRATAFDAARGYFTAGARLIQEDEWTTEYELAFALHHGAAECSYLCRDFDSADSAFGELIKRARTNTDRASIFNLRIVQYEYQSRYEDAINCARTALEPFGVHLPETGSVQQELESEMESIDLLLGGRRIADLADLPSATQPEIRMVMKLLTATWPSAYISGRQALTRLLSATIVRLSLEYGNAEESAYGYVTHAITLGPVREDYHAAYEFGLLALEVNERFNDRRLRAKVFQQFNAHVNLWRRPLETCIGYAREACRSGLENGDFTYGVYGAFTESWAGLLSAPNLAVFIRDYAPNTELFRRLNASAIADAQELILNWARALRGETGSPASLSHGDFDESHYIEKYRDAPFIAVYYIVARMHLFYLHGDMDSARDMAHRGDEIIHHLKGTIWPVEFRFWKSLIAAADHTSRDEKNGGPYHEDLDEACRSFAVLAANCPENFSCQSLILEAERERLAGNAAPAMNLYERAIEYAAHTGSIRYRALALELCARLQAAEGRRNVAALFAAEARACYLAWGAVTKWEQLGSLYPEAVRTHEGATAYGQWRAGLPGQVKPEGSDGNRALDHLSVLKAAQAIAGEMEPDKLLAKLTRIVTENAGATRGCLLLESANGARLHAECRTDSRADIDRVILHRAAPLADLQDLPARLINYVRRSGESIVLEDAALDERYGDEPHFARNGVRSIMCVPVINQGRLVGVIYLENNKTASAFTSNRISVCGVLASQAAVSLENSRLYDEMKSGRETLKSIMEGTAAVTGGDFFASLVRHLASAIPVKIAFVTECANSERSRARTVAFWDGKGLAENFEYEVRQTTCEKVYAGETCFYADELQKLFPQEKALTVLDAQSYIGLPIFDSQHEVIGHLAVIDDEPMNEPRGMEILKIFAARAGAELERMAAEAGLRRAMAEIEQLKNRLHAENIYLQEEIRCEHNFDEIVGTSPALIEVLQQVERAAPTDATVLILGETGVGKELIARAIHDRSPRRTRPLVKVNCGAISSGLVESELFGHVKGAFTGALDKRTGRFELANGGTIFLDEVGELPLEAQVKLLRVLQEGEFEPVGSSKTVRVDVRVIAATNRNLDEEVRTGRFRTDLFYRLNVLPINTPPLRSRRSDIPQLAMFFAARFARRFGRAIDSISQETVDRMVNYHWPGNIRELQNLIERAVILSTGSVLSISPELIPLSPPHQEYTIDTHRSYSLPQIHISPSPATEKYNSPPPTLVELQRQHILYVLNQTKWVIEGKHGAARLLDLHPNTLRSKLKKMGIKRPTSPAS
ncbi:MAG: sigma 54-interacting transcriptional regulator [Blastocatellales bacterium]|nr:sigma 54-interacting transcriptional regulator [Blastocatellales bacterium]